jgi:hypothetical protein
LKTAGGNFAALSMLLHDGLTAADLHQEHEASASQVF